MLTVCTTQVSGAPGVVAFDVRSPVYLNVILGAGVVRAEGFAALGLLAWVILALDRVSIGNRGEPLGAPDRVAIHDPRVVTAFDIV